jgi:hypothetical protein
MQRFLLMPVFLFFLLLVGRLNAQCKEWNFDHETCQKQFTLYSKESRFDCSCVYTLYNKSYDVLKFTLTPGCECSKVLVNNGSDDWYSADANYKWEIEPNSEIQIQLVFSTKNSDSESHEKAFNEVFEESTVEGKKSVQVLVKFDNDMGQTNLRGDFYFKIRNNGK